MGWCEYYKSVQPVSLREQGYAYVWAIDILTRKSVKWFREKESITALLGGFHAHSATARTFPFFCSHLHPGANNKLILLDMNNEPLAHSSSPLKVQGRLEDLPFSNKSIDLMVLDHTIDFMNDQQAGNFSREIQRVLTPEGIVLAAVHDALLTEYRLINAVQRTYRSLSHRVSYYPRSSKQVSHLFNNLTINLRGTGKCFHLLALSHPQSPYPVFTGEPFAMYEDLALSKYFLPLRPSRGDREQKIV